MSNISHLQRLHQSRKYESDGGTGPGQPNKKQKKGALRAFNLTKGNICENFKRRACADGRTK